jgi:hypothetical protein
MAFLLGYQSGTKISRFERLARQPNLETVIACQVVFGVPAHRLFPGVFAEVEKTVTERARLLRANCDLSASQVARDIDTSLRS